MDKEIVKEMRQAIKNNDIKYINSLLDKDAQMINCVTFWGTWLHDASRYGMYDVVKYLIEKGADVNKKGGTRNAGPLTNAAFEGHKDIIELLLENGAILDTSDFAVNPLFAAIYNGHIDVVKYLVENGIDLDASYDIGSLKDVDAYEYASQYGQTEIANYLKEQNNQ